MYCSRLSPVSVPGIDGSNMIRNTFCLVFLLLLAACTENSSTRPYILTTATTGGTYYPVGVALATITKSKLYKTEGISLSAISSAGSLEKKTISIV